MNSSYSNGGFLGAVEVFFSGGPRVVLRLVADVSEDDWYYRWRGRLHEGLHGRPGRGLHGRRRHVQAGRRPEVVRARQIRGVPSHEGPGEPPVLYRYGERWHPSSRVRPVQRFGPPVGAEGLAGLPSGWVLPQPQVDQPLGFRAWRSADGLRTRLFRAGRQHAFAASGAVGRTAWERRAPLARSGPPDERSWTRGRFALGPRGQRCAARANRCVNSRPGGLWRIRQLVGASAKVQPLDSGRRRMLSGSSLARVLFGPDCAHVQVTCVFTAIPPFPFE